MLYVFLSTGKCFYGLWLLLFFACIFQLFKNKSLLSQLPVLLYVISILICNYINIKINSEKIFYIYSIVSFTTARDLQLSIAPC